jgi:hypothetical protein
VTGLFGRYCWMRTLEYVLSRAWVDGNLNSCARITNQKKFKNEMQWDCTLIVLRKLEEGRHHCIEHGLKVQIWFDLIIVFESYNKYESMAILGLIIRDILASMYFTHWWWHRPRSLFIYWDRIMIESAGTLINEITGWDEQRDTKTS